MTDKEKLENLKKLADAMYYAAQHLTTDASKLHKAMDEYHKFVTHEYIEEEPVNEEIKVSYDAKINEAHRLGREEGIFLAKTMFKKPISEINFEQELYKYFGQVKDFTLGMRIAKRFYEIGKLTERK